MAQVALPFWLAGVGIVCSALGFFAVQTKEEGAGWNSNLGALMFALEKGMYVAGALFLGAAAAIVHFLGGMWDEVRAARSLALRPVLPAPCHCEDEMRVVAPTHWVLRPLS